MPKRIFITPSLFARMKYGVCPKCEEKIKAWQVVVKTTRLYYHFACYKKIEQM